MSIRRRFEPRAVAVVGASPRPTKVGHEIVRNLIADGFRGDISPVNPRGGEIPGRPVFRSVRGTTLGG